MDNLERYRHKHETIKDIHKVQGEIGNWDVSPYMTGLFNGLELALSVLDCRNPEYRDCPSTVIRKQMKTREEIIEMINEFYKYQPTDRNIGFVDGLRWVIEESEDN